MHSFPPSHEPHIKPSDLCGHIPPTLQIPNRQACTASRCQGRQHFGNLVLMIWRERSENPLPPFCDVMESQETDQSVNRSGFFSVFGSVICEYLWDMGQSGYTEGFLNNWGGGIHVLLTLARNPLRGCSRWPSGCIQEIRQTGWPVEIWTKPTCKN